MARRESDPVHRILKRAASGENAVASAPDVVYDVAALHPAESRANRLVKLEELRDSGVISAAEYATERAEIEDEL